jgi:oxygen-independent coproporphyrinogen III oxidase
MDALGIYIHVPFCLRKCGYCDFFSVPVERGEILHEAYAAAIARQLAEDARELRLAGREAATVYFGGGTPSILPPSFFASTLELLRTHLTLLSDLEVSCEVNPGTADAAWMRDARAAGITRCSIGVQSFHPHHLQALGRIHSADEAMAAIAHAQDAGFRSVSVDLMFGLPSETMEELEEDLRTAMTFQPEHLSVYQLTLEEGTPMHARFFPSIESREDLLLRQFRTVARMLARGGWQRYEISNFAKSGFECLHNLNYWRYGEYLGLGAGATSFMKPELGTRDSGLVPRIATPNLESRIPNPGFARRFTQSRNLASYLAGTGGLAESEEIDRRTAMAEYCFLGLRTSEGISMKAFEAYFGVPFDEPFGALRHTLAQDGLIAVVHENLSLSDRGREIGNIIFERFLP